VVREIIEILLANHANPDIAADYSHDNALMLAAGAGSSQAVKLLLPVTEKKPIVVEVSRGFNNEEKMVPWFLKMMFTSYGSTEWIDILRLLKAEGADLSLPDADECDTLLHRVLENFPSLDSVCSAMRDVRSSIDGCEDRVDPDILAKTQIRLIRKSQRAFMKHMQLLDFLLESNVNVSLTTSRCGNNALHDFLKKANLSHIVGGCARIIDRFLDKEGFDINAKNAAGETLLHIAASNGSILAVRYLISRGANINAQDKKGNTPLHYSSGSGDVIVHAYPLTTACLVQAGARTDIRNVDGLTAPENSLRVQNDFMETETFKSWDERVKETVRKEFQAARRGFSMLAAEGQKQGDFSDAYIKEFTENCRAYNINQYIIGNISVKDQLLVDMYKDDVTNQLMQIPVVLNERVYDLDTLLALHKAGKPDPFTQKPFDLSDIEPAEMIAEEIKLLIQHLQEVYPLSQSCAPGGVPIVGANALALGVNGIFGRSNQSSQSQSNEEEHKDERSHTLH
jgi:ankyrin repeat protein